MSNGIREGKGWCIDVHSSINPEKGKCFVIMEAVDIASAIAIFMKF